MKDFFKEFNRTLLIQTKLKLEEFDQGETDMMKEAIKETKNDKNGETVIESKISERTNLEIKSFSTQKILGISKKINVKPFEPSKPRNASKTRGESVAKRFKALNDNIKNKNCQITELNRQLK